MINELNWVLVAEDHLASRQLLERQLEIWGYRVMVASDGPEALRLLELPGAPSIALLDGMIPRVDGLEVCRRVRSQQGRPYQYLMLLVADNGRDPSEDLHEAGADDCVRKPFLLDELRARVRLAQRVVALERNAGQFEGRLGGILSEVEELRAMLPHFSRRGHAGEPQVNPEQLERYWQRYPESAAAAACQGCGTSADLPTTTRE